MSHEDVEIVRQHMEAYAAGDAERALSFVHPEVEVDTTRVGGAEGAIWHGYEGLGQGVRNFRGAFVEYLFELRGLLDAHDSVVGLIRERGRGKASGIETERLTASVYLLRTGKIVRITQYPRDAEALEAAGLPPSAPTLPDRSRASHRDP